MEKNSKDDDTIEYLYCPPSKEEIMITVMAPGKFYAKCRKCKQSISAETINKLNNHTCQTT